MQDSKINFSKYKDFSVQIGRSLLEFKIAVLKPGFFSKKKKMHSMTSITQSDVIEPQNHHLIKLSQDQPNIELLSPSNNGSFFIYEHHRQLI